MTTNAKAPAPNSFAGLSRTPTPAAEMLCRSEHNGVLAVSDMRFEGVVNLGQSERGKGKGSIHVVSSGGTTDSANIP